MNKFNIGDKVKVVNYGHIIISCEKGIRTNVDITKNIVGKIGIIQTINGGQYSIFGIPEKVAWYNEDQLELVSANINTL